MCLGVLPLLHPLGCEVTMDGHIDAKRDTMASTGGKRPENAKSL
jgi:hypothetical protein